jgi:hypothetical protein
MKHISLLGRHFVFSTKESRDWQQFEKKIKFLQLFFSIF